MGETGRNASIDIAKGIGISLVVLLHIPQVNALLFFNLWGGHILVYYMPLFFMLSGIFFKPAKPWDRSIRLLIPYFFFYVAGWILEMIKTIVKHETIDWLSFFLPFTGSTLGYANPPVWFLLSLAEVTVMSYVISSKFNKMITLIISLLIGIVGYYFGMFGILRSYYISTSLLVLPFFMTGYLYRDRLLKPYKWYWSPMLLFTAWLIFLLGQPSVNVSQCYIPCPWLQFAVIVVLSTVGIIVLSQVMERWICSNKVFSYFGKNSLIVLCTHLMLINIPVELGVITHNTFVGIILGFVIIMLVEVPIIELINKKCPMVIGKFKK